MTIALFPGSFDPITNGHIDILKQAAEIFDKVIIAIAYNPQKNGFLPIEERMTLIKESITEFHNVEVDAFEGLTVNYAQQMGASVIIRGLRNSQDFDYELQMAQINQKLNDNIKTIFLLPKSENLCVSSSAVREIISHGGDITSFVPQSIKEYF